MRVGDWVSLPWVYVNFAIYDTYVVYWCCIDLWLIGGAGFGYVCHGYMCIRLYMKLMQCSGVQRSIVNWRRGSGISLPWVYVHSAIYATYAVLWCCIDLWLIRGERSGQSAIGISPFYSILNLGSVVLLHRSMVN